MKATADLAIMIGWNAESFARTKRIKALNEYLKPPLSPAQMREEGAQDVRRMFERMIVKQGGG